VRLVIGTVLLADFLSNDIFLFWISIYKQNMLGKGVFDRNLKAKPDENISTFSFLFSEMANYCRQMDA